MATESIFSSARRGTDWYHPEMCEFSLPKTDVEKIIYKHEMAYGYKIIQMAGHLINRFDEEDIRKYLRSVEICPCEALIYQCKLCKFNDYKSICYGLGCKEARIFYKYTEGNKAQVKEVIRLLRDGLKDD